jgi:hypothetical protein
MNFFDGLKEEAEIKKLYKELSKKYHPDLGGDLEIMKLVNAQYEKALTLIYQKSGKSITEIDELLKNDLVLREKLDKIVNLDGLEIELCGKWIWITGETVKHKDIIKSLGFYWARLKKAWYWRAEEAKSFNRKSFSMDEIRNSHGSTSLKQYKKQIA